MLTVILLETEHAKNLGAICRVMANFGFKDLILVNPQCKKDDIEALIRAKHSAAQILQNAKEVDNLDILQEFDHLIATTAVNGSRYNVLRSPLNPIEMAETLHERDLLNDPEVSVGLLIGREGHGLFNEEIKLCDYVVTIPAHKDYQTMNISHAVCILLYEMYKKLGTVKMHKKFHKATAKDREQIMTILEDVLAQVEFKSEDKRETQRLVWKRIVSKSTLTKREAFALMGFLKKFL